MGVKRGEFHIMWKHEQNHRLELAWCVYMYLCVGVGRSQNGYNTVKSPHYTIPGFLIHKESAWPQAPEAQSMEAGMAVDDRQKPDRREFLISWWWRVWPLYYRTNAGFSNGGIHIFLGQQRIRRRAVILFWKFCKYFKYKRSYFRGKNLKMLDFLRLLSVFILLLFLNYPW